MPRVSLRTRSLIGLLFAILLAAFPARAGAVGAAKLPSLEDFIGIVSNGEADTLRGIYIPGVMASWIAPQPQGDRGFIYAEENTLTQFGLAERFGSTGLLAHNTLAGKYFSVLETGQRLILVYGDGRTESFVVRQILHFWALDPEDNQSLFFDLHEGSLLTASQLFWKVYAQPGHVILQTCIQADDEPSWGRLFVVAEPYLAEEIPFE